MNATLLRVENLSLHTRRTQRVILHDVSFQLSGGECIALIGPAESGKTLLLKLLNRLIEPTSGQIYLQGQSIYPLLQPGTPVLSISQIRQAIMLVMASSPLWGQTPREALLYPLKLRRLALGEQLARLQQCLEQFQIPEQWLDLPELMLSDAQRRWIAIARGWITRPQILLLDRPLQGLSTAHTQQLGEIITQLTTDSKQGLICVESDLDWLAEISSQAIYLVKGRMAAVQNAPQIGWHYFQTEMERQATLEEEDWD